MAAHETAKRGDSIAAMKCGLIVCWEFSRPVRARAGVYNRNSTWPLRVPARAQAHKIRLLRGGGVQRDDQ